MKEEDQEGMGGRKRKGIGKNINGKAWEFPGRRGNYREGVGII